MIGYDLASSYRLPAGMDDVVFTCLLLRRAGFDVREGDLSEEATITVLGFARGLADATPWGERPTFGWRDHLDSPPRASASEIIEAAVLKAVGRLDEAWAMSVIFSVRPAINGQTAELRRIRPVARAVLARQLRVVGRSIMRTFEGHGRFIDSDAYVDADGIRRARPGAA